MHSTRDLHLMELSVLGVHVSLAGDGARGVLNNMQLSNLFAIFEDMLATIRSMFHNMYFPFRPQIADHASCTCDSAFV